MEIVYYRTLILKACSGLILILAGSVGFASSAPDSWIALAALLAHVCGLLLLYSAIKVWMERFGGRERLTGRATRSTAQGCGVALLRLILIVLLIAGAGVWLYFAAVDVNEVRQLAANGRTTTAQVIGRDIVPSNSSTGYIHFAYRTSPTEAPEDRFAVPHGDYERYRIGERFTVTYAEGAHRVHRIGRVDWLYALRRVLYWLLLLAGGGAYLFMPLWLLEFRRLHRKDKNCYLANPAP